MKSVIYSAFGVNDYSMVEHLFFYTCILALMYFYLHKRYMRMYSKLPLMVLTCLVAIIIPPLMVLQTMCGAGQD